MILIVIVQQYPAALATEHGPGPHHDLFCLSGYRIGKGFRSRPGTSLDPKGNASGRPILLDDPGYTTLPDTQDGRNDFLATGIS
jgi:hypothetical protein